MRNIKLLIQYDGTRYNGWQSQEHTEQTIQGKLTKVLERMLGEEIDLQGSGRTDAGVHAAGQTANFRTRSEVSCEEILDYVNRVAGIYLSDTGGYGDIYIFGYVRRTDWPVGDGIPGGNGQAVG